MEQTIRELIREFGVPVALVLFFVWQSWKRENRMAKAINMNQSRISELEADFRCILIELCRDSTRAVTENTGVLNKLVELLEKIKCLPCVKVDDKVET